jgi:hypothetical protein
VLLEGRNQPESFCINDKVNSTFGFVRIWNLLAANSLNNYRKEAAMYILAAVIIVLLIALAGAELFLAQFNADELSNMGVEKK